MAVRDGHGGSGPFRGRGDVGTYDA
jgi:hypothetical protein